MSKKVWFFLILFLILYYLWVSQLFFYEKKDDDLTSPILIDRLGTIMSHSSDAYRFEDILAGNHHVYCYYPSNQAQYHGRAGEYILKRVESYEDCDNWFGIVVFREGSWVSEKEKILWSVPPGSV